MKKALSFIALAAIIFVLSITAFADGTTTLTTEVPSATYTMTIPEDCKVEYNAQQVDIGQVNVDATDGFTTGKNVRIMITKTDFKCQGIDTTIPFNLYVIGNDSAGTTYNVCDNVYLEGTSFNMCNASTAKSSCLFSYFGQSDGKVNAKIIKYYNDKEYLDNSQAELIKIYFNSYDWAKAIGGHYSATLTFISQVYASES